MATIPGATQSTYQLTSSDRSRDITVKVAAKRTGHTNGTAISKAAHVS
ncbi:hypothetical protein [Streptomyces sp. NPDC005141]